MKTNKITKAAVAILLVIAAMTVSVGAVQPRWDVTVMVDMELSFSGNSGTAGVFIAANPGTDNITATLTLYRLNNAGDWVEQMSWDYDVNDDYLSAIETFTGTSGREYKLELEATVTKGSSSDNISKTVYESCL